MITEPLTDPVEGMIIFSESRGLMAQIKALRNGGFRFHVLNGAWDGDVPRADDAVFGFSRVVSLTPGEAKAWYLDRANGKDEVRALASTLRPNGATKPPYGAIQ